MDEKQYLQEDFDPKSLKVAQLRGILNEYDISYPSNAKKTDLIMIFNDEVKPNASKHLQKYEKSIKNLNDVGFINATTGKPVRRSKRSTSADLEDSNATREKKSKATRTSAQASDVSGMESDTEVATKESKKTKRKPKDSKKMKNVSSDESADKTTASADISEIEIETRQELVNVDDGKSDSKGTSKAETKSESSFSNENVFQSPPSSAGTKNIKSPSNYKSPSLSKKRHRENDENQNDTPDKKPRVPSSKSPKSPSVTASKVSSHKKGHLFDDNESSDSDTDIFSKSIINQVKSPKLSKIKKPSSKKSTPIKIDKHTPVKKSTLGDNNITPGDKKSTSGDKKTLHQDTTPSQSSENHQHLSSAKTSSKKTNSVKSSVKKNKSPISDNSFLSLTEEQDDFDKEQSKIKSKGKTSTKRSASGVDVLTSADLASQLGITIQGLPPKDFQLGDNSFAGIKSDTPTKKLSPRSRRNKNQKISQPDFDKLSDDEEEKEEDKGKKFDKIQNGIKEEIEKLNDVLEKENSISIKKPSPISIFSFIGLWLIILSIGLSGYWYREQTYLIGYCGQEINQPTIPQSSDLPGWLIQFGTYLDNNFKPNCVKCPAHARCYPYLEIGCYEDFVEYKPWYFEFLPIINPSLKKCVPDTKKAEKLEIMIDVALDLLRSKNANKNCGKTPVDNFEAGLSVDELHDLLLLMKAPYITKEEFEELWQRSVIELEKEPEIITGLRVGDIFSTVDFNNTGKEEKEDKVFRSTSLSNLSLKCQLQNTIIKSMMEYKSIIIACFGMIIAAILLKYKYEQFKLERLKIETIYNEVLRKLRKQYKVSKSTNYKVPSYIGSTQLRDLILTNETNLTRKLTVWNKVSNKIENNSNIRYHLIENHGEIMKVWEWITDMEIHD